jgi:uncharacterized protein
VLEGTDRADWEVRPGVELVTLFGAEAGQNLTIYGSDAEPLMTSPADDEGRLHFAYIPENGYEGTFDDALENGVGAGHTLRPGEYVIRDDSAEPPLASEPFVVMDRDDVPDASFYEEQELRGAELDVLGAPVEGAELTDGYQYIEMRDGVQLSAMIRFPDQNLYGEGPWPTVIELSGYGPSNPEAEEPGSQIARSLGYATVSVNLRGTGCSAGTFDTFNPASMADGYDIVETVARQDWVLHNHVGMVGLSYSGITQLYTAATQPPSLAAVTAQSVIADPWLQQWPGGIYNDGFTREWLEERERQAGAGSGWVADRIDDGDEVCAGNTADHDLNIDFSAFGRALEMRMPDADDRDLRDLAANVDSAVLVTGAFQDEQTGPQFGSILDNFGNAEILRANLWNGRHPDGYSLMNLMDLYEFLELYVAQRVPEFPAAIQPVLEGEVAALFGFPDTDLGLRESTLADEHGDDYEAALAAYEAEDPIRVVFGSGLGTDEVGAPGGYAELRLDAWPSAEAEATSWALTEGGDLVEPGEAGGGEGEVTFSFDPEAGSVRLLDEGYDVLDGVPELEWTAFPEGASVSFETEPLAGDVVVAGPGYAELWVSVDAADADLQVTVSEVRDGTEYLVQNGWLRLGHRAEDDERSTGLDIVHFFSEEQYQEMPEGELVPVRVPLPAMGHAFAEDSSLRLTVSSPGRNEVRWTFEPPEAVDDDTTYTLGFGGDAEPRLVLPVLDAEVAVPDEVPCPGQRGIACRATG